MASVSIVRRIVAEHGGNIDVSDNVPRGTRFAIELVMEIRTPEARRRGELYGVYLRVLSVSAVCIG